MTIPLGPLHVDAADPAVVAKFWSGVLGPAEFRRLLLVVPERRPKVGKNRVHLDLYVNDLAPLLSRGARVLAEYLPERATLADVEGNEFCAFLEPTMELVAPARAFAVCTDSADPEALAAWWAPRVGAEVRPGPDGTPRWLYGSAGWEGLVWKFVRVPDERLREEPTSTDERTREEPNRWRWTVSGPSDRSDVDPQGNQFDVSGADPTR